MTSLSADRIPGAAWISGVRDEEATPRSAGPQHYRSYLASPIIGARRGNNRVVDTASLYNYDGVVTRARIVALDLGPKKALINKQAHGLSFEAASKVFDDPLALSKLDSESSEERWQTVGMVEGVAVFVVHTWPGEDGDETKGRIIKARRATSHERRAYEEGEFH